MKKNIYKAKAAKLCERRITYLPNKSRYKSSSSVISTSKSSNVFSFPRSIREVRMLRCFLRAYSETRSTALGPSPIAIFPRTPRGNHGFVVREVMNDDTSESLVMDENVGDGGEREKSSRTNNVDSSDGEYKVDAVLEAQESRFEGLFILACGH